MMSHYLKHRVTPTKVRKTSIRRGPLHSPYRKACVVLCSLSCRCCRDANSIPLSVVAANDLECAELLIDQSATMTTWRCKENPGGESPFLNNFPPSPRHFIRRLTEMSARMAQWVCVGSHDTQACASSHTLADDECIINLAHMSVLLSSEVTRSACAFHALAQRISLLYPSLPTARRNQNMHSALEARLTAFLSFYVLYINTRAYALKIFNRHITFFCYIFMQIIVTCERHFVLNNLLRLLRWLYKHTIRLKYGLVPSARWRSTCWVWTRNTIHLGIHDRAAVTYTESHQHGRKLDHGLLVLWVRRDVESCTSPC